MASKEAKVVTRPIKMMQSLLEGYLGEMKSQDIDLELI